MQLFIVVGILLAIDFAIMTTWHFIDPFYRETKKMEGYVRFTFTVFYNNNSSNRASQQQQQHPATIIPILSPLVYWKVILVKLFCVDVGVCV